MDRTEIFEAERPRLLSIASRVLADHAEAEDIVQHERDALLGRQALEHRLQGDADGVGQRNVVGWVGRGLRHLDVGMRDGGTCSQPVQAQPGGHGRQPRGQALDVGVSPIQPEPGLLHYVLGLGMVGEYPAGDAEKARSFHLEDLRTVHVFTFPAPARPSD